MCRYTYVDFSGFSWVKLIVRHVMEVHAITQFCVDPYYIKHAFIAKLLCTVVLLLTQEDLVLKILKSVCSCLLCL